MVRGGTWSTAWRFSAVTMGAMGFSCCPWKNSKMTPERPCRGVLHMGVRIRHHGEEEGEGLVSRGASCSGSGPSRIDPKAKVAASRLLQSWALLILAWTKGMTMGTTRCPLYAPPAPGRSPLPSRCSTPFLLVLLLLLTLERVQQHGYKDRDGLLDEIEVCDFRVGRVLFLKHNLLIADCGPEFDCLQSD